MISLERSDETFVECEISAIRMWKEASNEKIGRWIDVEYASDGESCEIDVFGDIGSIQTTSMPSVAERKRIASMINLMPYKEIKGGEESIYDNIDETFSVSEKVILYLQTKKPHMVCMGIYQHPFKDMTLSGPYWYTDGEYYWERETWKYVLKYHVKLPDAFIKKVMSHEGTMFLEKCAESDESWSEIIKEFKKNPNMICFMPDDAGDISLEEF